MNILDRLFRSKKAATGAGPEGYFEVPVPPGDGVCSDDNCPCPEVRIPRGTGYLYISQEVVDTRRNARTLQEAQMLLERMRQEWSRRSGGGMLAGPRGWQGIMTPILVCEQGARLRGIDLEVAAADAKHWWNTGMVPLRATPLARR